MRVITRDQVKAQLGISDSSLDAQIDAKLPIIDAKVKQITGNKFNMQLSATLTNGSSIAEIQTSNSFPYEYTHRHGRGRQRVLYKIEDIAEYVTVGDQISGEGIPIETHVEEIYYNGSYVTISGKQYNIPTILMSNNATTDGLSEMFLGINIGYHDIIAKGVQYLITGTSQSLPQNRLKSKSLPPLSVTYANDKIDPKTGMPDWFVSALPKYMSSH